MKPLETRICILFFIIFVMVTGLTFANTGTPTSLSSVENADFNGKWSSHFFGNVIIEQVGNQMMGTYQYTNDDGITKDGKIEGIIQGRTIQAKWWEHPSGEGRPQGRIGEESQGDLEWKMSSDGKTLFGWYREEGVLDQGEEEKHEWNLER